MAKYLIAHVRQGGQNMIIFPLNASFGSQSNHTQEEIIRTFQLAASGASLAGHVVVIWRSGNQTYFRAPYAWHSFFTSPDAYAFVMGNLNKELTI
ncbi:hypothetical protein BK660_02350 [Pseudomonas brassicacearum]|uniref:Uncharacterized protein n=1 Tax=Pseudomonas brassicacearum TaxID=930166 RepID=A0A423IGG9_9PSED|nr:hypothetical protein [Pseudomonas brassicacearum]RON24533.1 hypothetical protein BK660_02350 [Pseudomonas brassicacearum]